MTSLVEYNPYFTINWYAIGMTGLSTLFAFLFAAAAGAATLSKEQSKEKTMDTTWVYSGKIIDLRGIPDNLGKIASDAGVAFGYVYYYRYPSGHVSWRVRINDTYYVIPRSLVLLRSIRDTE